MPTPILCYLIRLKVELKQPVVVDLRNIYRPDEMAAYGFSYNSVGRPKKPDATREHDTVATLEP